MERFPDWHERLADCIETGQCFEFQYGTHDCCLWAAYCVDNMTGSDLQKQIQETCHYSNEEGAKALINAAGGLQPLVVQFLGNELDSPSFAAPGDLVVVNNEGQELVGIVVGHGVVAAAKEGLVSLPYGTIRHAWRI